MKISKRRFIWLVIVLAVVLLYFPVNRFVDGGRVLSLPLDEHIPLYPPALVPYILGSIIFMAFPVWAAARSKATEFEAYVLSILIAGLMSYLVYIIFPTHVIRPDITSQDIFSRGVALLYENDYPNNSTPSSHTFYILISFLYIRRWKPGWQWFSLIIAILVIASTVLIKQHYVLDVINGLALGLVAYLAGRYAQRKWNLRFAS